MTTKKITALVLSFSLCLALSFSFLFITEKKDHLCEGPGCPDCLQIEICQELLSSFSSFDSFKGNGTKPFLPLSYFLLSVSLFSLPFSFSTLVTLRVKLSR